MTSATGNFIDNLLALAHTSHEALGVAHALPLPQTITVSAQHDGVDEARKILRWLGNLQGTQGDMEQWMRLGQLPEQLSKADMLWRLMVVYAGLLKTAALEKPDIISHYIIDDANLAAGSLALSIALHTVEILPEGDKHIAALDKAIDDAPESWEYRQTQAVQQLIETIETALAHLSDKPINKRSPIDRLVDLSDQILQTANKLRSIDTLEEPAREESIELAREILRKLRGLVFSDKPIEEALDAGKPEEKLALTQKIAALLDSYKNLLAEARVFNPTLLHDARIQAANLAIGKVAHSIKLLAAKELPSNAAAAMQISADISQMPEEWKKLHDRTVDRLLDKLDQGLERAVQDIALEQQELQDQQDEHTEQKTEEQLLANALHGHGRRRRRRRFSGGGGGARSTTRNSSDINGDGILDVHQGKAPARRPGDLDGNGIPDILQGNPELSKIGSSLRALNQQAMTLPTAAGMARNDPTPDDKGFAERTKDQQTNPRNRKNPQLGG